MLAHDCEDHERLDVYLSDTFTPQTGSIYRKGDHSTGNGRIPSDDGKARRHDTCPTSPTSSGRMDGREYASWPPSGSRISVNDFKTLTTRPSLTPSHGISSYSITGFLGEGSHGKVLLARPKGCPQKGPYAIKVLRNKAEIQKTRGTRELKLLEWIAGRHQDGTNVGVCFLQKMIKGFDREDYLFIVMDRHCASLSDPAIAERLCLSTSVLPHSAGLSASVSLPLEPSSITIDSRPCREILATLRLLAAEIILGLLFLHGHGIVHQDIKPANILVSFAGHIVIGDFGAANYEQASTEDILGFDSISRTDRIIVKPEELVMHTPLYAAPEMVTRNTEQLLIYAEHVDWWALGVTLYELATGQTPFPLSHRLRLPKDKISHIYSRRSDGDTSISFGAFEKIVLGLGVKDHCGDQNGIGHFEGLLKELLVHDPNYRLHGARVKDHEFFALMNDPNAGCSWDDILAMRCPPLPDPICSNGEEGIAGEIVDVFGFDDSNRVITHDEMVEGDQVGEFSVRESQSSIYQLELRPFGVGPNLHSSCTLRTLPEISSLPDLRGKGTDPLLCTQSSDFVTASSSSCTFYPLPQRHTSRANPLQPPLSSLSPLPQQQNGPSNPQLPVSFDGPSGSMLSTHSPVDIDKPPIMSVSCSFSEGEGYSPPQPWPSTCSLVHSIERKDLSPHTRVPSATPLLHRFERPGDLLYGSVCDNGNQLSPITFHCPVLDSTFSLGFMRPDDFSMVEKSTSYGSNALSLSESWTFEENITIAILDAIGSRRQIYAPQLDKPPSVPPTRYKRKLSGLKLKRVLLSEIKHFMKNIVRRLLKVRP